MSDKIDLTQNYVQVNLTNTKLCDFAPSIVPLLFWYVFPRGPNCAAPQWVEILPEFAIIAMIQNYGGTSSGLLKTPRWRMSAN